MCMYIKEVFPLQEDWGYVNIISWVLMRYAMRVREWFDFRFSNKTDPNIRLKSLASSLCLPAFCDECNTWKQATANDVNFVHKEWKYPKSVHTLILAIGLLSKKVLALHQRVFSTIIIIMSIINSTVGSRLSEQLCASTLSTLFG